MKELKAFDIDILRLSNKEHAYQFEGDKAFFAAFPEGQVADGTFSVNLKMKKSETMLQLSFDIRGSVVLTCDRSMEPFDFPIRIRKDLILKFGDHNEELTDEIEMIDRNTQRVNMAHYIYEFIGLAIPMKKLHPSLQTAGLPENEEGILIYSSPIEEEEQADEEDIDPRWAALKKLK